MGFFSRIGNKVADSLIKGARVGAKVLGQGARIGNKIADVGSKIVSGVERIPILGQVLAPATGVARSGLAMVKNAADVAGRGSRMLTEAGDIVRQGREVVRSGDIQQAQQVLRRSGDLGRDVKGNLQRASKITKEQFGK
tara:strand:+ start:5941 stop:6357 length:417 start_codon:yes stop_codon:yes gene_type:complete